MALSNALFVIVAALIVSAFIALAAKHGTWLVSKADESLVRVKCKTCQGTGKMVLANGKITPIPRHLRIWDSKDPNRWLESGFNTRLANAINCHACTGRGFHLKQNDS